jgi:ribulose-5-phosphate 4-epimerase/fuculose-1-phosphate aldolase
MIDERLYEEFRDIGRDIYVGQLTSSHGGNMSVRVGDRVIIKRRGAQLGRLKRSDFVETSLYCAPHHLSQDLGTGGHSQSPPHRHCT